MKIRIWTKRKLPPPGMQDWFAWHPVIAYDRAKKNKYFVWFSTIRRRMEWRVHRDMRSSSGVFNYDDFTYIMVSIFDVLTFGNVILWEYEVEEE